MLTLFMVAVFTFGVLCLGYFIADTFFYPPDNRDDKDDAPWNQ
jgi:hypothetical protein